jgi:hypothetical protein
MSDIVKPGPWQLRFVIVNREDDFLLYLTNNGLGKVVTVEPEDQPDRQIVRLNVFSVCIIDTVPTIIVVCCTRGEEKGLLHNHNKYGHNQPRWFNAGRRQ